MFWRSAAVTAAFPTTFTEALTLLRKKWHEVPAGADRLSTRDWSGMGDAELLSRWAEVRDRAVTGENFPVRGWYHLLYSDILRGKKVMDVGSGLGIDGLSFAQAGAKVTFVDIVQSNLDVLQRLAWLLKLSDVRFCYLDTLGSLQALPCDYDVIWCQGSLINAPMPVIREEVQALLKHLPVGGRWVELAYPRERWEREGRLPFDQWGKKTDGEATPWVEWYDLRKLREVLAPARFDVVLELNFHNNDFNWFDLVRCS